MKKQFLKGHILPFEPLSVREPERGGRWGLGLRTEPRFMVRNVFQMVNPYGGHEPGRPSGETPGFTAGGTPSATDGGFMGWTRLGMTRLGGVTVAAWVGVLILRMGAGSFAAEAIAGSPEKGADDLAALRALSLEDLLNTEVTSLNRRSESLRESPGAVFVIGNDEIRRSGARSISEVLRLAPGISVASMDANKWAISSRGFNNRFTDSLLVLVDGRSVYTPNFSGVYWDQVRYPLEDIERIEVIRGPGGSVWGANAVNGVINIITKSSNDTLGGYTTGGFGTENAGFTDFRYGWEVNEATSARAFFSYGNSDDFPEGYDGWYSMQSGFRVDWERDLNQLTFQGDGHYSRVRNDTYIGRLYPIAGVTPTTYVERKRYAFDDLGGNVLGRFTHGAGEDSEIQLRTYYDYVDRRELEHDGVRQTFDVDFQHRFPLPWNQSMMYGFGYRYLPDEYRNPDPEYFLWNPKVSHWQVFSGFLQDEVGLVPDELTLTLGSKLEHNDSTGWEVQPDARLAWVIDERQTLWGSVARAVQVPGRNLNSIERVQLPYEPITTGVPLPLFVTAQTSPGLEAAEVLAYELGYRLQPIRNVSVDLAGFINTYDHLVEGSMGVPNYRPLPYPHLETSTQAVKTAAATSWGAEASVGWEAAEWCRFTLGYSFYQMEMQLDPANGQQNLFSEGVDPENQISLRASFDLPGNVDLDFWTRWVDRLPAFGVDGYFDLDVRLAWRPRHWLELALVGQNLVDAQHPEFGPDPNVRTQINEVPRGVYGQITARF